MLTSFLGMPGNNSTSWGGGDLSLAVQRGNWATEQCGSPAQGDLVTEGANTCFSREELQEFFSGLPGQSFGSSGNQGYSNSQITTC